MRDESYPSLLCHKFSLEQCENSSTGRGQDVLHCFRLYLIELLLSLKILRNLCEFLRNCINSTPFFEFKHTSRRQINIYIPLTMELRGIVEKLDSPMELALLY
ncbi:hypothetical protein K7432_014778 [Basidiobolus ranarum]|uniref:Maturase K n=1 Tax=Basidiobolus ranarum TaxID=34480 RepID=A0ABR2VP78_9FUNG